MTPSKKIQNTPPPQPPTVSPKKGIELLTKQIEKGTNLLSSKPIQKDAFKAWESMTQACLEKAFGLHSPNISKVIDIGKYGFFSMGNSESYYENIRAENLTSKISMLKSQIEILEMEESLSGETEKTNANNDIVHPSTNKIFLVHGHNEGIKNSVARFLEKLELQPIILHEMPNIGRTIIEKISDYSNVGFAIVLMTADDIGGVAGAAYEILRPRTRQNVIFELGYFIGKLGRPRVCALYQNNVELPSDYDGVLFVKLDEDGAWKMKLAKEIKAVGINLDMNKAL